MSPNEKKELERLKTLGIREDLPENLTIAIETFLQQAIIVGEYELDSMPGEYVENLLKAISEYTEYTDILMDLMNVLDDSIITEN